MISRVRFAVTARVLLRRRRVKEGVREAESQEERRVDALKLTVWKSGCGACCLSVCAARQFSKNVMVT
jgi:hypothetical protein